MRIDRSISPPIIAGAAALLAPFCEGLTPTSLVESLRAFDPTKSNAAPAVRASLTIKQAAEHLQLSEMSVFRLLKDGKLPRVHIGKRAVRIPAAAIDALLSGEVAHV